MDNTVFQNKKYSIDGGIIRFINDGEMEGNNKKYLEFYNKIARFYNFFNKIYFIIKFGNERNYRNQFLSELEIKNGDKVLEVSAGTGDNFPFLNQAAEFFGIDISLGMLKQAVRHLKKWKIEAELIQAEAENLPFKDNSFDVVYHIGGINYFNDKQKAINEMIRVAKSGSRLMIVDETEKLLKGTYQKAPLLSKYYNGENDISAPTDLLPEDMIEIKYKEICNGLMYCITFRKP